MEALRIFVQETCYNLVYTIHYLYLLQNNPAIWILFWDKNHLIILFDFIFKYRIYREDLCWDNSTVWVVLLFKSVNFTSCFVLFAKFICYNADKFIT